MRFSFLGFRLFLFLFVVALGHFVLLLSRQPRIALIGVSPFSLGRRKDIGVRLCGGSASVGSAHHTSTGGASMDLGHFGRELT